MLYSNKNIDYLNTLMELVSLQNQLQDIRLQDKLSKRNCHENIRKLNEPLTVTIKKTSENLTKTMTEISNKNNKALENLDDKVLEIMNDRCMIAPYLASSLINLLKPENKSQNNLIKEHSSIRMNDFLVNGVFQLLYINMLSFRDSNKSFKIDRDLLEAMTDYDFNVSHSNPQDQKLIYQFGKQMINIKQKRRKVHKDKCPKSFSITCYHGFWKKNTLETILK